MPPIQKQIITPEEMPACIYDFYMPKNLYSDLVSTATWKHHTISEEIRTRLSTSLIKSYGYNYRSDLTERIRERSKA